VGGGVECGWVVLGVCWTYWLGGVEGVVWGWERGVEGEGGVCGPGAHHMANMSAH